MPTYSRLFRRLVVLLPLMAVAVGVIAYADDDDTVFRPGNLVVSRSVYDNRPANVAVGEQLPPGCSAIPGACVSATNNGVYPFVFDNNLVDGSFGLTSRIFLDQLTPEGHHINTLEVPNSLDGRDHDRDFWGRSSDIMVTSYSSKSELALNLSTDHRFITFMGYIAPVNATDVSNSNTPLVIDPTNPVGEAFHRAIAQVDARGHSHFTETNAYSGNNGRAAILNSAANVFIMSGNAGNGGNPQPNGVIEGGGAQITDVSHRPESDQNPALPTPVGSFNITEVFGNTKTDKIGKDTNFRGLTIFNNVVYLTKGSGGNGINTVYFIDTVGTACAKTTPAAAGGGVGLPVPGAPLPTLPIPTASLTTAELDAAGVTPYNMCILKGFNTQLAKTDTVDFPFGLWFANATTLYVADEGSGTTGAAGTVAPAFYAPAVSATAGIQKWVLSGGTWSRAYVLNAGLGLGSSYVVGDYPTGVNPATNKPWAPGTDGIRNITGRVNGDGTVTIWGITSTISGSGDQGADPNRLVRITDTLTAVSPAGENFVTVRTAKVKQVLRGVSFTPTGGDFDDHDHDR